MAARARARGLTVRPFAGLAARLDDPRASRQGPDAAGPGRLDEAALRGAPGGLWLAATGPLGGPVPG